MATRTIGTIASAHSRLEKQSGLPLRLQCVAIVGGSCGYAQIDIATASAAITRPNQRLRMRFSPKARHEIPHDFLKAGRMQPIPVEPPFALGGVPVARLEHAAVVRPRRTGD